MTPSVKYPQGPFLDCSTLSGLPSKLENTILIRSEESHAAAELTHIRMFDVRLCCGHDGNRVRTAPSRHVRRPAERPLRPALQHGTSPGAGGTRAGSQAKQA